MNRDSLYTCLLLIFTNIVSSQTLHINLQKSDCELFGGYVYFFGLREKTGNSDLCVYKYNQQLELKDSLVIKRAGVPASYLQVSADTLHNYLNIYLQQKDAKTTSILRLNTKGETVALVETAEVARLNSLQVLGAEKYYYKNFAYAVKYVSDSSGRQFYLNKFKLISEKENFDYNQVWQFPFERKNIHDAHIFFANDKQIMLYVIVASGTKKGNWILRIDAASGQLIKGSKLNGMADTDNYLFGNYFYDTQLKALHLWGQKITIRHLDYERGSEALANLPALAMYYTCIDSLGEIVQKQDFSIPVTETKSGAKKTSTAYLIKISNLVQQSDKSVLEADIYKSQGDALCFNYSNTQLLRFEKKEDTWVLQKTSIGNNPQVEDYFLTGDKLNLNGRQCAEKLTDLHKLYYSVPGMSVKAGFKPNAQNQGCWLLTKSLTQKNTVNVSVLAPSKTSYQLKTIADVTKDSDPKLLVSGKDHCLLYLQVSEAGAEARRIAWP